MHYHVRLNLLHHVRDGVRVEYVATVDARGFLRSNTGRRAASGNAERLPTQVAAGRSGMRSDHAGDASNQCSHRPSIVTALDPLERAYEFSAAMRYPWYGCSRSSRPIGSTSHFVIARRVWYPP